MPPQALGKLQSVAKATGDSRARDAQWEEALEHYFSAMELSWQREPGGGLELGTLHANCSICMLRLGLEEGATSRQIKMRYYDLAKRTHPDVNKHNPAATAKFGALTAAYETLVAHAAAHRDG